MGGSWGPCLSRGQARAVLAVGDGLLELLILEPANVPDEFEPDSFPGAPKHLHRLLVSVSLDRAAVNLNDLVVDGDFPRPVRRTPFRHALDEDP